MREQEYEVRGLSTGTRDNLTRVEISMRDFSESALLFYSCFEGLCVTQYFPQHKPSTERTYSPEHNLQ